MLCFARYERKVFDGDRAQSPDETLEILRRQEPLLHDVQNEQRRLDDRVRGQGERLATIEGRVSQLPTLIQIVGAMLGINAGIIALGVALAKLLSH